MNPLDVLPDQPWWARLVELVVITGCLISLMLVMAKDPSSDDVLRGVVSGFVGFLISQITSRFAQNVKAK